MAADSGFFRIGSVNNAGGGLLPALRHNKRDLPEKTHIDPSRSALNYCLHHVGDLNTPQAINRAVNVILAQHDIKPRKNACMAIECVFSLPANRLHQNTRPFFEACLEWIKTALAGVVLSFDIHLDEAAPHAHALILPLCDGKLQGRNIMGSKANIYKLQNAFMQGVGSKHGLKPNKRLTATTKAQLYSDIIHALEQDREPIMQSKLWDVVRDHIRRNPLPYAQLLGIATPASKTTGKSKTFVEIMTKHVKPEPKNKTAIAFLPEKEQTLCSV
jgi:hypothetical protein